MKEYTDAPRDATIERAAIAIVTQAIVSCGSGLKYNSRWSMMPVVCMLVRTVSEESTRSLTEWDDGEDYEGDCIESQPPLPGRQTRRNRVDSPPSSDKLAQFWHSEHRRVSVVLCSSQGPCSLGLPVQPTVWPGYNVPKLRVRWTLRTRNSGRRHGRPTACIQVQDGQKKKD